MTKTKTAEQIYKLAMSREFDPARASLTRDGRTVYRDYGKGGSGLTWVLDAPPSHFAAGSSKVIYNFAALDWGTASDLMQAADYIKFTKKSYPVASLRGNYWVSPFGNRCFTPAANGSHRLLFEEWKGDPTLVRRDEFIYYNLEWSKSGKSGVAYAIVTAGYSPPCELL